MNKLAHSLFILLICILAFLQHSSNATKITTTRTTKKRTVVNKVRSTTFIVREYLSNIRPDVPQMPLPPNVQGFFFDQNIDHFNKNSGTFRQRYFQNIQFYKPGGPILLWVNAQGSLMPQTIALGSIVRLANATGALLLAIEQRYFGESFPVPDLSLENLQYYTTEQAVEDIGNFILNVPLPLNVTRTNARWGLVGGSIGGNLAAWARVRFPNLVDAVWASSAPVSAINRFPTYDSKIGESLGPKCGRTVSRIFNYFDRIDENELYGIKKAFNCTSLRNYNNFAWALAEMLGYLAQYSNEKVPPTINDLCYNLDQTPRNNYNSYREDALIMASFAQKFFKESHISCEKLGSTDDLISTKVDPQKVQRQIFYQMCREMGQWQIANSVATYRSKAIDYTWFSRDICYKTYGISEPAAVNRTNRKWGGESINISRIVFTTGTLDPWYDLTITEQPRNDMPVYIIHNGRHNDDLKTPLKSDSRSLAQVRARVFDHMIEWLQRPRNSVTTVQTFDL